MHLKTWENTTKREQALLLMSSHPSTNTSPRKKSQVMERQTSFQLVLLHLTPLLRALSGPSPVLPLFPTSLPEGPPSLMICSKAPSDLLALSGTWSVRCSLAACIRVCAWPHRCRVSRGDGPGCPFLIMTAFFCFTSWRVCGFVFKQALTPSAASTAFAPMYSIWSNWTAYTQQKEEVMGTAQRGKKKPQNPKSSKLPSQVTTLPPAAVTQS